MAPGERPSGEQRSIGPILLWSVAAIALLYTGSLPVTTNDLHVYLIQGRWMLEHGQLMETEVYTYVAQGDPYMNGTWGFGVLAYLIWEVGGYAGLRIFNGLMVSLACLGVSRAAVARGIDQRAAAAAAFYAWILLLQNTVVRGQTWCFPVFAALSWLAATPRAAWKHLLGGVVGGSIWAALHGSFGAGIVWMGALAVGDAWDRRDWRAGLPPALTALGMLLGTFIGPYGPTIWDYVYVNSLLSVDRGFGEWRATELSAFEGARFYGALALWMLLLGRSTIRARTATLLHVIGFGYLGVTGIRFVAWFGLGTAMAFAQKLVERMDTETGMPARLVKISSVTLGAAWLLFLVRGLAPKDVEPLHKDTPVAHVDAIEADAEARGLDGGRIFGPPEYGGYVSWRLWPEFLHCGDIRTWVFDNEAWNYYLIVSWQDPDWEETLDRDGVTHLMLWEPFHKDRLLPLVRSSDRWALLHEDEWGASFRRADAIPAPPEPPPAPSPEPNDAPAGEAP